jgi:hypothetical protein
VQHSAAAINAFAQLGLGEICFLKVLDYDDVKALCGREMIAPHQYAVALLDADGSPHLIRGTVAECVIEAHERGLRIVTRH